MKFTKLTNNIGKFMLDSVYVLLILLMLGLLVVYGYFFEFVPSVEVSGASLGWIVLLPTVGIAINVFLGHFFGDEYYNTGHVSEGRSRYDIVKTPKYYTRRMFFCFVECFLFLLLIVRYLFLFSKSILIPTVGIICSIVAIIIFFIVGMSSYEQSGIKDKWHFKKENKKRKSTSQNKERHKFKFNKYPELLEKYNQFKICNSNKYKSHNNTKDKETILKEIDESFESLAHAIFVIFNEKKPDLIIKKTGEKLKWEDVINKPFEELSYMEKQILVRLLDRLYKYVLPDDYYNF